jgi:hypothetical protein
MASGATPPTQVAQPSSDEFFQLNSVIGYWPATALHDGLARQG